GIDKLLVTITFLAKSSFSSANPNFVEVLFRFTKRNFRIAGIHHRGTEGTKEKGGIAVWGLALQSSSSSGSPLSPFVVCGVRALGLDLTPIIIPSFPHLSFVFSVPL